MKAKSVFFFSNGVFNGGRRMRRPWLQRPTKSGAEQGRWRGDWRRGRSSNWAQSKGTLIGAGAGYLLGDLISPFIAPGDNGGYAPPPPQQSPPAGAGNCYWRQETNWGPDGRPHQIQRRVCEGETPWHPDQY